MQNALAALAHLEEMICIGERMRKWLVSVGLKKGIKERLFLLSIINS